jgi:glycosyltransferase involved in cell wall biosynthesis
MIKAAELVGKEPEPLVSVALPVYNGATYLAEAMDSILAQTLANFELIALDDGSTDGSIKILREYECRDARVRVIARENRGLVTTLNENLKIDFPCVYVDHNLGAQS